MEAGKETNCFTRHFNLKKEGLGEMMFMAYGSVPSAEIRQ